ncbi:hypothetical protein N752_24975 [Desulforamulus aquiferis]|nr:hypothetical protein N752_24975 [Desulforamulus aquiferis]
MEVIFWKSSLIGNRVIYRNHIGYLYLLSYIICKKKKQNTILVSCSFVFMRNWESLDSAKMDTAVPSAVSNYIISLVSPKARVFIHNI